MTAPDTSRYRLARRIGVGGMGEVWEAEDTLLRRRVALKFLPPEVSGDDQARRQLLEEARASSVLSHPGIATVYDTGELDGRTFIAMRLVDGETLTEKLGRGLISVDEAVRLSTEIADALDHAHAHGVVHGDLSPRNVMVTGEGHAVVVDFGLARRDESSFVGGAGQGESTAGTAGFLAPEVVRGEKPGRAADIYSLGVLLYEMLTGARPFGGERLEAILYATLNSNPEPPSRRRDGIAPDLEKIVLSTLAKAPGDRPESAAELAAALRCLTESRPGRSPGPGADSPTRAGPGEGADPSGHRAQAPSGSGTRVVWTSTPMIAGAVSVTLLVVAGLVWGWMIGATLMQTAAADEIQVIAVLPFRNLAKGQGTDEHLAEGLTRSLINKIVHSTDTRVVSWLSVGSYAGSDASIPAIARALKVDALVVGRYRSRDGRISCQLQLLDGATGSTLWSEEFHEDKTDIFVLEARMGRHLAGRLRGVSSEGQEEPPASARDPKAYELYLKAARALQVEAKNGTEVAEALLKKAVELDPELALAHVALGALDTQRYFFGWAGEGSLDQAEEHFKEALRLEPTLPSAHSGLISAYWAKHQPERMLKQAELAVSLDLPLSEELFLVGRTFALSGLPDRAMPILDELIDLEPNHRGAHWFRVFARNWAGDYEGSIAAGRIYQKRFGDNAEVSHWIGASLIDSGRLAAGKEELESALRLFGRDANLYTPGSLAGVYELMEEHDRAEEIYLAEIKRLEALLKDAPDNDRVLGVLLAIYVRLNQWDKFDEHYATLQEHRSASQWRGQGDVFVQFLAEAGGERTAQALAIWRKYPPGYLGSSRSTRIFGTSLSDIPGGEEILALSRTRHEYLVRRYGNLLDHD